MSVDWSRFREIVDANESFLLTSHIRPDCDALGSELGMAGVLEALGKKVTIVNGQQTPPNLEFLDPGKKLKALGEDITADQLTDIDVLIVLDTSAWKQLGPMADVVRETSAKKLIIDHHVGEDDMGAELLKDTKSEATGRLIVEIANHFGVEITPEIAMPVFAAIATDTGWFRFRSVSSSTYNIGAQLIDSGADPQEIYSVLYEQDTLARLQLRGRILARVQTDLDGRLAHTVVHRNDFDETGAHAADTEDAINLTLGIAGVEFAVILVELPDGVFKISFRSRCGVNCAEVASGFEGGGHKAAAGGYIKGPYETARDSVLDVVRTAMG